MVNASTSNAASAVTVFPLLCGWNVITTTILGVPTLTSGCTPRPRSCATEARCEDRTVFSPAKNLHLNLHLGVAIAAAIDQQHFVASRKNMPEFSVPVVKAVGVNG